MMMHNNSNRVEMCKFTVIGIPDSSEFSLSEEAAEAIEKAHWFSGGKRHHQLTERMLPDGAEWIDVTVPLSDVFKRYRETDENIVVFASGDPLFFGYAATLQREFPTAEIKVFPWFNSLQTLAHRMVLPYQEMRCVSLTGRPWHEFYLALISGEKLIGVLTDRVRTPKVIAERMIEYGYSNYLMTVGENLGNKESERISTMRIEEAATKDFDTLNCIILTRQNERLRPFGIPDREFAHLPGREKMITKMPIRLLALAMLDIHNRKSLWDVGFCTGSVSIEAKLQAPHLTINAFEVRKESKKLMEANSRKFGTPGIDYHIGDFLETDISDVPAPDAVFIGGHGGKLKEIVRKVKEVLLPGGVIVFNSVSAESLELFEKSIEQAGMSVKERHTVHLDAFNPITVMQAK